MRGSGGGKGRTSGDPMENQKAKGVGSRLEEAAHAAYAQGTREALNVKAAATALGVILH